MSSLCRLLEWDSAFFGYRIAQIIPNRLQKLQMADALNWCQEHNVQCVYFRCAPDDDLTVQLAEMNAFHLVDVRMELSWMAKDLPIQGGLDADGSESRLYCSGDMPELLRIAETAYRDTRFYYDRGFTREQSAALYREWIAKSCDSSADAVWIALRDNGVGGFVTCHIETLRTGRIGLLGVARELRGMGIGQHLVRTAQAYFVQNGVSEVHVVTQGRNIAAQRLYQRNGFVTHSVDLWYHKWFIPYKQG